MTLFKALFTIDAIAVSGVVYFFFIGLWDGTVSARNFVLWAFILIALAAIMFGSMWLRSFSPRLAIAVLLILAVPALLYFVFMMSLFFGNVKFN
jgi:hypothetical protein